MIPLTRLLVAPLDAPIVKRPVICSDALSTIRFDRPHVSRDQLSRFDVDTEEWEQAVEDVLSEVEYDTELGKEMGRDAIRLARGQISEAEFHEKHHEAVCEVFGFDDRPTKPE